jgi:hypothetical protein
MITQRIFSSSLIFSAVLAISACGGTNAITLEEAAKQFTASVTSGIAALTDAAGLSSKALPNLFADNYKDGGFTKADVVSTLAANSTALPAAPELSLFPMAAITNTTISGCDNGICTLSGTLTNSDVDTTSVDFSTKVIVIGSVVYFYGDQSSTSSI